MTGNVVFLGFALAGAPDFGILDSFVALVSFGVGAVVGGKLAALVGGHRGKHLSTAATNQVVFLAASVVLALASGIPIAAGYRYGLQAVIDTSMGIQNATARKLGVPDMTTTVLTLTITGIGADSALAGGLGSRAGRRLVAVGAMLAGAGVGTVLVLYLNAANALVLALPLVGLVAAAARCVCRTNPMSQQTTKLDRANWLAERRGRGSSQRRHARRLTSIPPRGAHRRQTGRQCTARPNTRWWAGQQHRRDERKTEAFAVTPR
jgi:uncharacterized membrane protein YoaK (UPF0700 family)